MSISTEFSNAIFYNEAGQICKSGHTPQMLNSFYSNLTHCLLDKRQPIVEKLSQLNANFDDKEALSTCEGYSELKGQETEANKSLSKIYSFWMRVANAFMFGTLYTCVLCGKITGLKAKKMEAEDALENLEIKRVAPIINEAKVLLAKVSTMLKRAKAPIVGVIWGNQHCVRI